MKLEGRFLLLAGAASLFAASTASAQVCVDPAGGGCMTTIQAGVDVATAGQTIAVAPATYSETVDIPAGKDGLVINASGALLDNPSSENGIRILSNDVTIRGLSIRNGNVGIVVGNDILVYPSGTVLTGLSLRATGSDSVRLHGADETTVSGCRFDSCGGDCLDALEGDDANGADGTVVTKNTFRICDAGCVNVDGDDAVVTGNKMSQSEDDAGIEIDGDRALVEKNKVSLSQGGIVVIGALPVVTKNKVDRMGDNDGIEVECLDDCDGAVVLSNKVSRTIDDANGIYLYTEAAGLVAEKNSVSGASDDGIEVAGIGVTLTGNKVKSAGGDNYEHCYEIGGQGHVVTGNSAEACASDGFHVSGFDIAVSGNTAEGNFGDGFDFDDYYYEGDPLVGIVVSGNTARNNIGNGFAAETGFTVAPGLTLTGNTSSGNRDDLCADLIGGSLTDGGGNSFTVAGAPPCEVDHD